jgi:hypothetical protein
VSRVAEPCEPRLWLFNLDAELELASGNPQTPRRLAQAFAAVLPHARKLMAPGDECLNDVADAQLRRPALLGCPWCPTPSALKRLSQAGARLAPSPPVEVLRRVSQRSFYLGLGGGAPGARYIRDADDLAVTLREMGSRAWLFKKPYGFAGRGQRRVRGEPTADDRRWLDAALRRGGFVAEPWLDIELEVGMHGCIEPDGRVRLGRICVQQVDAYRAWVSTRLAEPEDVDTVRTQRLQERAASAAEALWTAGYWGPFGIDAYLWRTPSGSLELNPMGELNARYTMGFAVGMGCDDFART